MEQAFTHKTLNSNTLEITFKLQSQHAIAAFAAPRRKLPGIKTTLAHPALIPAADRQSSLKTVFTLMFEMQGKHRVQA